MPPVPTARTTAQTLRKTKLNLPVSHQSKAASEMRPKTNATSSSRRNRGRREFMRVLR